MNPFPLLAIVGGLAALPFVPTSASRQDPAPAAKANRYIGAKACKSCHFGATKGEAHEKWTRSPHANAFATLATPAAKEIGKKLKIEDPQQAKECLPCHVTGYGVPANEIKPKAILDSVQCESCHGPGENHQKARNEAAKEGAAKAPVADGEILRKRDVAICQKCHNEKSPTFTPFCLVERMEKIEHLDPRKQRSDEDLKKLRAGCTPDCPKCKQKQGDGK